VKQGKSSDVNLILISLLNKAKIETHPVLISTRDNNQVDLNFPDARQFNHVIALAKIGDKRFLLDATDSMRPHQFLDKNHLARNGFLVKSNGFGWLKTKYQVETSTNVIEKISINNQSTINQDVSIRSIGYDAIETRKEIKINGVEKLKRKIANTYGINKVDTIENIDNEEQPLVFKHKKSNNLGMVFQINPKLKTKYTRKDFTEYKRSCPVEFSYPYKKSYTLIIQLEDGYECVVPESHSFSTYDNNAYFDYHVKKENNLVKVSVNVEIKLLSFPKTEYPNIKELFNQLNEKLNEKIILRKKIVN